MDANSPLIALASEANNWRRDDRFVQKPGQGYIGGFFTECFAIGLIRLDLRALLFKIFSCIPIT